MSDRAPETESDQRALDGRRMSIIAGGPTWIVLYGPSGSGKTTVGKILAAQLGLPVVDLDEWIVRGSGQAIPEIFEREGEAGFRQREAAALRDPELPPRAVISLGGGALLDPENKQYVEGRGRVFCLTAPLEVLLQRLRLEIGDRPLLTRKAEAPRTSEVDSSVSPSAASPLASLLERRGPHYASFQDQLPTGECTPNEIAWQIQVALGWFQVRGMGSAYDVLVQPGGLDALGEGLRARGSRASVGLVTDENVAPLYAARVEQSVGKVGISFCRVTIPPGEAHKTIMTIGKLWNGFLQGGLERRSTVLALGGGVVGDLAGFAAATFLRGIPWAAIPTTLLAMVDASLGGKTGADLPEGKNLVGAFHSPRLVLADPDTLSTLPPKILRAGMAEVIKHGVIGDPGLFDLCRGGLDAIRDWPGLVSRAMGVKIRIIQEDPYEQDRRAALNLGHTIGHGIELASGFGLSHGESVAIGMVVEARLAERIGLAESGLASTLASCLHAVGLPADIPPGLDLGAVYQAMAYDKKKAGGKVRFALPAGIGDVRVGIEVPDVKALLNESIE